MKNSVAIMSLVAGATMLTGAAVASPKGGVGAARAPAPATAEMVSSFVDRYAARETVDPLRSASSNPRASHATDVTLYPTADREVVFVSFRIAGVDRIALVATHGGHVTRFTDFTGARPKHVPVVIAHRDDVQMQAQSILSPTASVAAATSARAAPDHRRTDVQAQAADLLHFASVSSASAEPFRIATVHVPAPIGDSQQMARALLTPSHAQ